VRLHATSLSRARAVYVTRASCIYSDVRVIADGNWWRSHETILSSFTFMANRAKKREARIVYLRFSVYPIREITRVSKSQWETIDFPAPCARSSSDKSILSVVSSTTTFTSHTVARRNVFAQTHARVSRSDRIVRAYRSKYCAVAGTAFGNRVWILKREKRRSVVALSVPFRVVASR